MPLQHAASNACGYRRPPALDQSRLVSQAANQPIVMLMLCPFCEIVMLTPPLETEIDVPPLVICTPEPAVHDCVVELTLVFEPFAELCELCTLTTQVEHEPPLELVETLLLCCCDPSELDWLTCTLTWQPPVGFAEPCAAFELARVMPTTCSTGRARSAGSAALPGALAAGVACVCPATTSSAKEVSPVSARTAARSLREGDGWRRGSCIGSLPF